MSGDPQATFRPQSLDRRDVEHPLTPGMRHMEPAEAEKARQREIELDRRFEFFSPISLRRAKLYVICAVICVPLINVFLTPLGLGALYVQIPVAAMYGVVMAWARLRGLLAAFAFLATGLLTLALAGYGSYANPIAGFSLVKVLMYVGYMTVGYAVGMAEELKRGDGD
jgi:hypothetical protein